MAIDVEKLIKSGTVPVMETEEGLQTLFNYFVEEKRKVGASISPSRKLKLSDSKTPNDSKPENGKDAIAYIVETKEKIHAMVIDKIKEEIQAGYSENESEDKFYNEVIKEKYAGSVTWEDYKQFRKDLLEDGKIDNNENAFAKQVYDAIIVDSEYIMETSFPYHTKGEKANIGDDSRVRVYVNVADYDKREKFLLEYTKKCLERNLPFNVKGWHNGAEDGPDRLDRLVLYLKKENAKEQIEILEEIRKENPELVEDFGSPNVSGMNVSYYSLSSNGGHTSTYNYAFDNVASKAYTVACAQYVLEHKEIFEKLSPQQKALVHQCIENKDDIFIKYNGGIQRTKATEREELNFLTDEQRKQMSKDPRAIYLFEKNIKRYFSLFNFGDEKHLDNSIAFRKHNYEALGLNPDDFKSLSPVEKIVNNITTANQTKLYDELVDMGHKPEELEGKNLHQLRRMYVEDIGLDKVIDATEKMKVRDGGEKKVGDAYYNVIESMRQDRGRELVKKKEELKSVDERAKFLNSLSPAERADMLTAQRELEILKKEETYVVEIPTYKSAPPVETETKESHVGRNVAQTIATLVASAGVAGASMALGLGPIAGAVGAVLTGTALEVNFQTKNMSEKNKVVTKKVKGEDLESTEKLQEELKKEREEKLNAEHKINKEDSSEENKKDEEIKF